MSVSSRGRHHHRLLQALAGDRRRTPSLAERDPVAYALALHRYAAGRVDPQALHSWLVWRLMADRQLGHEQACLVADAVVATEHDVFRSAA